VRAGAVAGVDAEAQRQKDAALLPRIERLQDGLPGRRHSDRLRDVVDVEGSAAERFAEGAPVRPVEAVQDDQPHRGHRRRRADDHADRDVQEPQGDEENEPHESIRPALDERVERRLDPPALVRPDGGIVDLRRGLAEGQRDHPLQPAHRDHRPASRRERRPGAEHQHRPGLQPGRGAEAQPLQDPAGRAELQEERDRVQRRLEGSEEAGQVVRLGVHLLDEDLELEIDQRRDDDRQDQRQREHLDVAGTADDVPPGIAGGRRYRVGATRLASLHRRRQQAHGEQETRKQPDEAGLRQHLRRSGREPAACEPSEQAAPSEQGKQPAGAPRVPHVERQRPEVGQEHHRLAAGPEIEQSARQMARARQRDGRRETAGDRRILREPPRPDAREPLRHTAFEKDVGGRREGDGDVGVGER